MGTCWPHDGIVFYSGNGCQGKTVGSTNTVKWPGQDWWKHLIKCKQMSCFSNDDARSAMILPSWYGNVFLVADDSDKYYKDDCAYVVRKKSFGQKVYCVQSFEYSYEDEYVKLYFHKKNGLDVYS